MCLDWDKYIIVAERYQGKAQAQDREDLKHTIILSLAQAQRAKDNNGGGQLSDVAMLRLASFEVAHYWRNHYRITNGLDCHSCSKAQRLKCRKQYLYTECPKAIKIESLDKPIVDNEGNFTTLGELIADDKAINLDRWLEASTWLLGYPKRLIEIAQKRVDGKPLTKTDRQYLWRYRKREQNSLIPM